MGHAQSNSFLQEPFGVRAGRDQFKQLNLSLCLYCVARRTRVVRVLMTRAGEPLVESVPGTRHGTRLLLPVVKGVIKINLDVSG